MSLVLHGPNIVVKSATIRSAIVSGAKSVDFHPAAGLKEISVFFQSKEVEIEITPLPRGMKAWIGKKLTSQRQAPFSLVTCIFICQEPAFLVSLIIRGRNNGFWGYILAITGRRSSTKKT